MSREQTTSISVSITKKNEGMIAHYMKEGRHISRSEVIRHCINKAFAKDFPNYVLIAGDRKDEQDVASGMSNEEYCVKILGGTVDEDKCVIPKGNMETTLKLDNIKDFSEADI